MREIARTIRRSVSTISNEITLNKVKGAYEPTKAHHKAYVRRKLSKYQGKKIIDNATLQEFVEEKLYDGQSPVNISERIKKHEKRLANISKESIYRYIKSVYGRRIEHHRNKRKKRRWNRRRTISEKLKDRKFIDTRPRIVEKRSRIGDVEADFIVSGKSGRGILLVVADRKSRAPFLEQITDVTITNVHSSFLKIQKRFPEIKTITTDNDILLTRHKELEILLGVRIYFCHPYHSWEKGTVENVNGYIRRDIPKGSDISRYSKRFILSVENKLQRRIMGCLNYLTPYEVISKSRKQKKRRCAH